MGVRHEKVILSMEDEVSTKAARAAASVMLLDKSLDGLSGRAVVTARATASMSRDLAAVPRSAQAADRSINQLTGRLAVFRDLALTLGPALNPVGGVLIAGVGGLANQLGVAALAGGSMIAAFQGVGDALEAVNKAALEPTADNIAEANRALSMLTPAARDAVGALRGMVPTLKAIRDAGGEALFPDVIDALDSLESRAPDVARIVASLNGTMGDLLAGGAARLSSSEWDDFFDFLATDARDTLEDLGKSVGFIAEGLADLWMAFDPLNDDFSGWALNAARDFSEWADALAETQGFAEFVAYVRQTGPQVADTFGAMGNAILQIVQATAPLGGPALRVLEAVADVVAAIADSDLGTPFFVGMAALAAYNRTLSITAGLQARVGGSTMLSGLAGTKGLSAARESLAGVRRDVEALGSTWATAGARTTREQARIAASTKSLKSNLAGVAKGAAPAAAGIAGLTLASTGAADGLGLTNTASLALMGTLAGPWGAAVGAGVGILMDAGETAGEVFDSIEALSSALGRMGASVTSAELETLSAQLQVVRENVDGLSEMRDNPFGSFGNFFGSIKNDIEDTFGASDIEEAERAYAELEERIDSAQAVAADTAAWQTQAAAIRETRAAADQTAREFITLGDSLDDSKVSLTDWIRELESQASALRDFRINAQTAADRGLRQGLIAALQEAGPAGALRLKQLANASDKEIGRANKAWIRGQREIERYKNAVDAVPDAKSTNLRLKGRAEVIADALAIRRALDEATRNRHVNVTVSMPVLPSDRKIYGGATRNADGGTVPRTGLPYADRHHYLLADGEEVISNRYGQADRWRPLLKAINANRLADGGTAGKASMYGGIAIRDWSDKKFEKAIDRLADRVDKAATSLDEWRSKMKEAGDAATEQFGPDLFKNDGPWSRGSNPLGALAEATAGLNQRNQLLTQLKKAGVRGEALTALMAGSNTDITALIGSGGAGQYQRSYDAYLKAQSRVANRAGQIAYGPQETAAERRVNRLEKQLKALRREQAAAERRRKAWEERNDDIGKKVSKPAGRGAASGRRKAATR